MGYLPQPRLHTVGEKKGPVSERKTVGSTSEKTSNRLACITFLIFGVHIPRALLQKQTQV